MASSPSPFESLEQEHRLVGHLLGRLEEIGERIARDERVSPGTVRLGVGLLDAYLHRVHARQFDVDLWPEAKRVAGRGCREPLETVWENHLRMRRAAQNLLELTGRWADGDAEAQAAVARALAHLAAFDAAANAFEEQHPFSCLRSTWSADTHARLSARLEQHRATKRAVERRIAAFLRATAEEGSPLGAAIS